MVLCENVEDVANNIKEAVSSWMTIVSRIKFYGTQEKAGSINVSAQAKRKTAQERRAHMVTHSKKTRRKEVHVIKEIKDACPSAKS